MTWAAHRLLGNGEFPILQENKSVGNKTAPMRNPNLLLLVLIYQVGNTPRKRRNKENLIVRPQNWGSKRSFFFNNH